MLTNFLSKSGEVDFSLLTGRSKVTLITKNIRKIEDAGFLKVYRLGPGPADFLSGVIYEVFDSTPDLIKNMRFASLCKEAAGSTIAKRADVFHIHGIWGLSDLEYANLGVYLSQLFRKPLVVTLHGGFVGDPLIGGMQLEKPEIKRILTRYADVITTYSRDVFNFLGQMGLGEKTQLITNFVDTTQFVQSKSKKNGNTVVYVGRLEGPQTPELLVEAFKQVHNRIPNAKLHIVGYGSLYDNIKRLIHCYGLDETVILKGKQTDVRPFLWNSDIFVATNFGYVASLEAWSAGLALVAPNFGVLRETVTDHLNGLLIAPKEPAMLAAALIELLENKQLCETLALNGKETVKNYDVRAVAPKILDIYKSLVKN